MPYTLFVTQLRGVKNAMFLKKDEKITTDRLFKFFCDRIVGTMKKENAQKLRNSFAEPLTRTEADAQFVKMCMKEAVRRFMREELRPEKHQAFLRDLAECLMTSSHSKNVEVIMFADELRGLLSERFPGRKLAA